MRQQRRLHHAPFPAMAAIAAVAFLGACSGAPGGGGSDSSSSSSSSPAWATASYAGNFNATLAASYLNSTEFQNVNGNCGTYACSGSGTPGNQSNPYALHNVHVAHGAGLSGAGQLVAVVDTGVLTTHQEFSDKTILTYGAVPAHNHGTHVASLVAGDKDETGMYGIAYNASLHLTSVDPGITDPAAGSFTLDIAHVTAATFDAASKGAVAQNNSWGFDVKAEDLGTYLSNNPGASTAAGMNNLIGYGTSNWQNYINAFNTFQNIGVIVWAMSNDESYANGDALGTLPYFETSLQDAWITAVNGYFEVDSNGGITDAVRLSAACGYAASFCIAGDGTTYAAEAGSGSDYGTGTGTSYVAPQISGAVAILAEAFPGLRPSEWTDRLLASADNSWFQAEGVAVNGTTDFGNGIRHGYSNEWGHGVLDLEAALKPIGTVSVNSGASVYDGGSSTPVSEAGVTTSAALGDGLASALSGRRMAVFDALNANFAMDAGILVQGGHSGLGRLLMDTVSTGEPNMLTGIAGRGLPELMSFSQEIDEGLQASFAATNNLALAYAPSSGAIHAPRTSVLGLASTAATGGFTQDLGGAELSVFGFAASHDQIADAALSGVGANLSLDAGAGTLTLGVRQVVETGGMLGLAGSDALDFGTGSTISALDLGFEQALAPDLTLFAGAELGLAAANGGTGGLVSGIGGMGLSGFEAGIRLSNVGRPGDRLTFSVAQPLRVESGTVDLDLPVGRTGDGTILHDTISAPLAPSGREIDLSLAYDITLDNQALMKFALSYALDAGHVAGRSAAGAAASYRQSF